MTIRTDRINHIFQTSEKYYYRRRCTQFQDEKTGLDEKEKMKSSTGQGF